MREYQMINTPEEADLAIANLSDEEILNTPIEDIEKYIQSKQKMMANLEDSDNKESSFEEPEETAQVEQKEGTADDKTAESPKFGSFKIGDEDIPLNSEEDMMQLARMGVQYATYKDKIKPIQKIAKTLEKNELLSEDKINFIVDLMKGNPKAISKLIADNGLDIYTDFNDKSEYSPSNYMVTDKELQVQDVLDNIKNQDKYEDTLDVISKMDNTSKSKFYDNPDLITVLNNQIKTGDYQKITKEIKRLKTLGYIPNADDFTNYFNVGKMLFEAGKLSDSPKQPTENAKATAKKAVAATPKGKSTSEPEVDMSKYYDMSDEEILKLDLNSILR